ncbi:MAG TPA: lipase family protein [Acidimicrobiales bacterium]|nr:lipase family protein [Acidimicrobiales bacterium]
MAPRNKPRAARDALYLVVGMVLVLTGSVGVASASGRAEAASASGRAEAAAASAPLPPNQDPFYNYSGSTPLADLAPGTVLKQRPVQVALGTTTTPVTAEQLLYRTTGELGQPIATVTTVLMNAGATTVPDLVDYLSFYDALGAQCDPSYTLQGGSPGSANEQQAQAEEAIIAGYLANNFIVTVPDFEGPDLEWTAGYLAGYASLDAIRATESYLKLPASTKAGLTGYSGGSIAAEWASEVAPRYAPQLDIIGVAEGGIPVDYAHNLAYINGATSSWSSIIPAVLVALSLAYGVDLTPYLSPYGVSLTTQDAHACIGSLSGVPGLTVQKLLKPQYQNFLSVPVFAKIVNDLIMGSVPGHPTGPLFMGVGDSDGTGDGIMVTADVEGLAHQYCQQGVPLQLSVYQGSDHTQAAIHFEPGAISFLQQRFAGVPFQSGCASVPSGNSLAPLPIPEGYWETASGGGVFSFGSSGFHGSMAGRALNAPIVGMAATPDGGGYWLVASDGGVFSFGDARFYGSTGGKPPAAPIVGMAATPDGGGYWLVASNGGVFSFGDAIFYGSMGGRALNAPPIVGIASAPHGWGYWLVASNGGVFSFGDTTSYGSMGGRALNAPPIVGMAATPDGGGYWLVASAGGVFSFGDARFYGSMGDHRLDAPVVGAAPDV